MNNKMMKQVIGAGVAAMALVVVSTMVVYPAISQLVGLAVAQTSTKWNNVKDAAAGDNLETGILMVALGLFDGTNFDRARGDTTFGLDVDVTRLPGSGQTPADDFANPSTFLGTWSLVGIFDGTTWDRWRGQVVPIQAGTRSNAVTNSAANTALNVTIAAAVGQQAHVYHVSAACTGGGTAFLNIMNGATTVEFLPVPSDPMKVVKTWSTGMTGDVNTNFVINLSSCGVGNVGTLTVQADRF